MSDTTKPKPIEFIPMPQLQGEALDAKAEIVARIQSINDAMGVPESSQRSESKPVRLVDSKTGKNDANGTWVTVIWFSNGHKVSYESRDKWTSVNEAQVLARDYMKSLTPDIESNKSDCCTISTDQDGIINGVTTPISHSDTIENIEEGWKLYTYRNLTNGMLETKLVDCYGSGYFGQGKTVSESRAEAVKAYKAYQLNGIKPISRSEKENKESLASDIRAQEMVMAGLIEKAKRSGIDGRLVAMAATKFEFGFMALDKALTTHKE